MGEAKKKVDAVPVEKARELYNLAFRTSRTTISVIDAMTQRGAIKGEELSAIGQLRDQCVQLAQLCEAFQSEHEEYSSHNLNMNSMVLLLNNIETPRLRSRTHGNDQKRQEGIIDITLHHRNGGIHLSNANLTRNLYYDNRPIC